MTKTYFVPRYLLKRLSVKLTKLLENRCFTVRTTCVCGILKALICSHGVTPRWLDDAKECIQSGWSKQRDCCSLAQKITNADAGRFEATFLKNYLVVSAWIFIVSLIECHEKKHWPFSLSGIRFLGENLLRTGALERELSTLDYSL